MSFIIWYKVEFNKDDDSEGLLSAQLANVLPLGPSLPLTVSNDIFSGKYILDANITLTMNSGGTVDTFEITLPNLPADAIEALQLQADSAKKKGTAPLLAKIYLGYFDEITTTHASEPVLAGGVLTAKPDVKGGLRTIVLTGQEIGGYRLSESKLAKGASIEGKVPVKKLLTDTVSGTKVGVESSFGTEPDLQNYKFRSSNKLGAVIEIAELAHAPLVIRDKKVYIGSAVGSEPAPQPLSIVQQSPQQKAQKTSGKDGTTSTTIFTRKKLTVLGHPLLRVGQVVKLENQNFRIEHLVHKFSTLQQGAGYTCEMILVQAEAGEFVPENVQGAQGVAEGLPASAADKMIDKFQPDGLLIVRAGGEAGLFSAIIGGWPGQSVRDECQAVTKEIRS